MQDLSELSRWQISGICTAFGAVGGALNYWLKVTEGRAFSWTEFLAYTAMSAFSGFIAYECLDYLGLPAGLCAGLCGMSGWMGTRLLRIGEIYIRKKLDISKDDLND